MPDFVTFDFSQFAYFHFLRPWWLLALIPLLYMLRQLWKARDPMRKWRQSIAPHLLRAMLIRQGRSSKINPVSMSMVLVVLAVLSLSGPSWRQQPTPFSEDITPLVIVLDVSDSMQQQDVQPSRLERAKQKIHDLMQLRPGGRVGLVVYAGSAHSVIPLTNDSDVIENFLNAIVTKMMPRKGKFPEKALPLADKMLRDQPLIKLPLKDQPLKDQPINYSAIPGTILLIGDGISAQSDKAYEEYFSSHSHQLLVYGIGTNDADISLERTALEKLAHLSGGYYQQLTLNKDDVIRINQRIKNHLVIVEDGSRPWLDAGYYLLFPLMFILLLWFRKGWTLRWCIVLLCVSVITTPLPVSASEHNGSSEYKTPSEQWRFMDIWLTPDQQGRYYLKRGDYKTAANRFQDITWKGIAYYRDENFNAAIEMFSRIDTVDGVFNLANAYAQSRNYVLAVKTYDRVLKMQPGHKSALKNRDKIQSIIDEINLMSEAQQPEQGEASKQLGEDDPQTAEGAEKETFEPQEKPRQLTAEEILFDESINEIWMQQVQQDPSRFLSIKFNMQLQNNADDKDSNNENGGSSVP